MTLSICVLMPSHLTCVDNVRTRRVADRSCPHTSAVPPNNRAPNAVGLPSQSLIEDRTASVADWHSARTGIVVTPQHRRCSTCRLRWTHSSLRRLEVTHSSKKFGAKTVRFLRGRSNAARPLRVKQFIANQLTVRCSALFSPRSIHDSIGRSDRGTLLAIPPPGLIQVYLRFLSPSDAVKIPYQLVACVEDLAAYRRMPVDQCAQYWGFVEYLRQQWISYNRSRSMPAISLFQK